MLFSFIYAHVSETPKVKLTKPYVPYSKLHKDNCKELMLDGNFMFMLKDLSYIQFKVCVYDLWFDLNEILFQLAFAFGCHKS